MARWLKKIGAELKLLEKERKETGKALETARNALSSATEVTSSLRDTEELKRAIVDHKSISISKRRSSTRSSAILERFVIRVRC
jgi:hypothetical protein